MARVLVLMGILLCLGLVSADYYKQSGYSRSAYKKHAKTGMFGIKETSVLARALEGGERRYLEEFCKSLSSQHQDQCSQLVDDLEDREVSSAVSCGGCKAAVDLIKGAIKGILEKLKEQALNLCNSLPAQFQEVCKKSIPMIIDSIYQFVEQNVDPEKFCTKIKLCP